MPIHDLGYRRWSGRLTSDWSRWSVIAETGARRVWQSTWVRRILFFAWLPLLLFGTVFVLYERAAHGDEMWQRGMIGLAQGFPELRDQMTPGDKSPTQMLNDQRHTVWLYILQYYFRYPQGVAMVLLIGLIAPRLISEDVETRAFLFYFSRPLGRLEYLLGKSATVWLFIAGITTLPALCMYLLGIVLSPEASVVFDTWDIPLRILVASVTVIVPATAIALCFSSLTKESRYAAFAWFAVWILGMVAYLFIAGWRNVDLSPAPGVHNYEELFSLHHTFGAVQRWIFGLESFNDIKAFAISLSTVTAVSLGILFRRVSAPMRA